LIAYQQHQAAFRGFLHSSLMVAMGGFKWMGTQHILPISKLASTKALVPMRLFVVVGRVM